MNAFLTEVQKFFCLFAPYAGISSDLDGTAYDTEWVAARVTAQLTLEAIRQSEQDVFVVLSDFFSKSETQEKNSWLKSRNISCEALREIDHEALTDFFTEYVCLNYSGRAVEKQVPMIEADLGITLPHDFISRKKARNIEVLGTETRPIEGYTHLLEFVVPHKIPFACLTASPPDRVVASLGSSGLDRHLSVNGADGKIPVISTEKASTIYLAGREISIPKHPAKPEPHGYIHTAETVLGTPRQYTIALEDSSSGVKAAGGADHCVGLVVTGGHFPRDPHHHGQHVKKLQGEVGHSRHFVIDSPRAWAGVIGQWAALAVAHAVEKGVPRPDASLQQGVADYIQDYFAGLPDFDKLRPVANQSYPQVTLSNLGLVPLMT